MGSRAVIGGIFIMCVASIAATLSVASEQPAAVNVESQLLMQSLPVEEDAEEMITETV